MRPVDFQTPRCVPEQPSLRRRLRVWWNRLGATVRYSWLYRLKRMFRPVRPLGVPVRPVAARAWVQFPGGAARCTSCNQMFASDELAAHEKAACSWLGTVAA